MVNLHWPEDGSEDAQRDAVAAMLDWVSEGLDAPVFVLVPNPPTPVDRAQLRAAVRDGLVLDLPAATFALATRDRARASECAALLFRALVDQVSIVALQAPLPASPEALGAWVGALLARPFVPAALPPVRGVVFDWGAPLEVLGPAGARVVDPKLLGLS